MPEVSDRLQNLPPFIFQVISHRLRQMASEGIDVIRADVGNPDLPPADFVIDALSESARKPNTHGYSGYTGIPSFRNAVASYYQKRFGVELDPNTEILPLIGSKEGIVKLSLAFLGQGDTALIPQIAYPSYEMGARLAGADLFYVPMSAENGFLLGLDEIPQKTLATSKILWANYPNNPTGATAELSDWEKIISFCATNDILLAADNPYVEVTYGEYKAISALQVPGAKEHAIEFMSFSKSYNMAGWRLGAAVGSADALKHLLSIKSNMDSGHFAAIYDAGIAAIEQTTPQWLAERNAIYEKRRDTLIEALPEIGLSALTPKASLYIWAKVTEMDATEYVQAALEEAHVSLAPGATYGPGGNGYVRISLAVADERLKMAIERLKAWYRERK